MLEAGSIGRYEIKHRIRLTVDLESEKVDIRIDGHLLRDGIELYRNRYNGEIDEFVHALFTSVGSGIKYYPTRDSWKDTSHHLGDLMTRFTSKYLEDFHNFIEEIWSEDSQPNEIQIEFEGANDVISVPFELMLSRIPKDGQTGTTHPGVERIPLSVDYLFTRRVLDHQGHSKSRSVTNLYNKRSDDLNVLIIKSATYGNCDLSEQGIPVSLALNELAGIEEETRVLKSIFPQATVIPSRGKLIGSDKYATWNAVSDKIREKKWDIVHFAGHGFHLEHENKVLSGIVLSSSENSNVPVAIPAAAIQESLVECPGIALIYLSSCEGAMQDGKAKSKTHYSSFDSLIESFLKGCGCVIAYRWPVSDKVAPKMAAEFYTCLKARQKVEIAMQQARYKMFYEENQENAWASAVLAFSPL